MREDETEPMARAAIQVLMLYDISVNPKIAAWCTLGMVAAPPVLLRIEERREARKVQEAAKEEAAPEPAAVSNDTYDATTVTPAAVKPESKPRRGRSKKT